MAKQRFPWWAPTRCISRVARAIVVLCFAAALHDALAAGPPDAALWVADHERIERINPATDQITLTVSVGHDVRALAVDPRDKAVWVLTEKRLVKFDSSGHSLLSIEVATLTSPLDEPKLLALNPYDGSLWVGGEKTLRHLDDRGRNILDWRAPGLLRAVALDADESLWILVNTQLLHVSAKGKMLAALDVGGLVKEPRFLAIDNLGGIAWIAGGGQLVRFDLTDSNQAPRQISLLPVKQKAQHEGDNGKDREEGDDDDKNEKNSRKIAALGVHPVFGTLWVATRDRLLLLDRSGAVVNNLDLGPWALGRVERLAWEPLSASLWLAGKRTVAHLTGAGEFVGRVTLDREIDALGTEPFHLLPTLSILEPPDDSLTNNPNPLFLLGLGADCNGFPCALADAYTRSLTLDAMLNGAPVGNLFSIANDQARYTPSQRLPEGATIFTAQAKDVFGHSSKKQAVHFIIDTVPPVFVSVTPGDGSFVNAPQITVSGNVDDAGANVVLRQAGNTVGMAGAQFSFSVHLAEGSNSLDLIATDRAGNGATLTLHLTLDTVPPAIPGAGLITVSCAVNGVVTVTGNAGSVEPNAQVIIRNTRIGQTVTVTANADGSFTATIAAQAGDDFVIIARDKAGNESAPTKKSVLADYGAATAYISGTVVDAASGVPLVGVQIRARGLSAGSYSDASGHFVLAVPGRAAWALFFERAGYIAARRDVATRPGGDASVGHVALRALESKTTSISAASGGTLTDATGNVQVVFPPGALTQNLQVSATYLPSKDAFPLPLPENLVYAGGVQMGPEHVTFNKPVTMRVRNTLGLPAGTEVNYFFASHDADDVNEGFYDPGVGVVSPDGRFVEYRITHFSCMALGKPAPGSPGNGKTQNANKNGCGVASRSGSSTIDYCSGNLHLEHRLPAVQVFGENDAPSLVYDSSTADPRPLIAADVSARGFVAPYPQPIGMRARVSIEGVDSDLYLAANTTSPYVFPGSLPVRFQWNPVNGRGQALLTGTYPYTITTSNLYRALAVGGTTITTPTPFSGSATLAGRVILQNESQSPFGAGWTLAELARLYPNADGTLLLTLGQSQATVFSPVLGHTVGASSLKTVTSGLGEARSIAVGPNGELYVSLINDGKVVRIAPDGGKTVIATGLKSPKGLAVAPDGAIYVISLGTWGLYRIPVGGAPQLIATLTSVDHVDDVAVAPDGDIYVLDGGFGRIWAITPSGTVRMFYDGIAQGYGQSLLSNAMSMAFDAAGNLYVSNNYNSFGSVSCGVSFISKFDRLGNHSYFRTGLNSPRGVAVDKDGNVFVADYDCNGGGTYQIKMLTPAGEEFVVMPDLAGSLNVFGLGYDLAWSNGQLYLVRSMEGDVLSVTLALGVARTTPVFRALESDFSEIVRDAHGNYVQTRRDGTTLVFNAQGLHIETRTPQGRFWRYEYDSQGRLLARVNAAGQRWTFGYNGGRIAQIADPASRVVTLTVDGGNNLVRVDEPGGSVMSYTYGARHEITSKTDSRGFTTAYQYGPLGNVIEARQATGEVRKFTSARMQVAVSPEAAAATSANRPIVLPLADMTEDTYTDGLGNVTRFLTNRYGSIEREIDALGRTTVFSYNTHGQPTRVTYPDGSVRRFLYDTLNRLVEDGVSGRGNAGDLYTRYSYDALNRLTATESNFAPPLGIRYDDRYNPVRAIIGSGSEQIVVNTTYNGAGQPLTSEIGGKVTRYEYDAAGRVVKVADALGNATVIAHDVAGNRTRVQDALGRVTRDDYDDAGRLVRETDPVGGVTQFTWQAACATCGSATQLLTSISDPNGNTTRFEYDEIGQMQREIDPAGHVTRYAYDMNRNLVSITDPNGNVRALTYDAANRLVSKSFVGDTVNYRYDAMDRFLSAINGASTLDYLYDSLGRVTTINTSGAHQAASRLSQSFNGYVRSYLSASVSGNGFARIASYDSLYRPTAYQTQGIGETRFSYDNLGRLAQQTTPTPVVANYSYDDASRLTGVTWQGFPGALQYSYDAVGNPLTKQIALGDTRPSLNISAPLSVTADTLTLAGRIIGDLHVTLNGTVLTPDAQGNLSGTLPLTLGNNAFAVVVTNANGEQVTETRHVSRVVPPTGIAVTQVLAIAPNGDVYFLEGGATPGAAVIPTGSGRVARPAWLTPASDVAVDAKGVVYTRRGTELWRHDATGDRRLADLTALAVTDIEVGPDDQVYLALDTALYRLDSAGRPILFVALPPDATGLTLDASAWGFVAYAAGNGTFYQVHPDATATVLLNSYGGAFALDPRGTLCQFTDGWFCFARDGRRFGIAANASLQFDVAGLGYTDAPDNVLRLDGTTKTPLITTAGSPPQGGTLTLIASANPTAYTADYAYDANDRVVRAARRFGAEVAYAYDALGNRLTDATAGDYRRRPPTFE